MSQDQEVTNTFPCIKKWIHGEDYALDQILSFDKYPLRLTAERRKHESQGLSLQSHCDAQQKCL